MAALLMLLTAVDEGLGACFFGRARAPARSAPSSASAEYAPIGGITVGCRSPDLPPQDMQAFAERRRALDEVVHRGQWGVR